MTAVPLLLSALVGAAAADDGPAVRRVTTKTFRLVQRELGVIEAGKTLTHYAEADGEIIWIAPEGSHVQKGDPVVKLANSVTEEEAEQDARRLEDAKMALRRAELDHELKKREAEFDLKRKEVEVRQAEWELRDLKQRATQRQLKMLELDARIAKYQMDHAKLELDAVKALQGTSLEMTEELKTKTTAHEKAVVAQQRAMALQVAAQKGPNRRRVEVAEKRLERARQSLELEKRSVAQRLKVAQASVEMEQADVHRAQARAERSAKQASYLTVRAKMAGTVALMNVWKGEGEEQSPIRVGETRHRGMDLLRIADLSELLVLVHLSEADVRHVKVKQKAAIRLVAFPDRVYHGAVHQIAPFAEDKNIKLGSLAMSRRGVAGVNTVDVRVKVLDDDPRLRLGLTAQVDVTVVERGAVLTLPHTALWIKDGQAYCYTVRGGAPAARRINTGPANEDEVVVEDGLEEGDTVHMNADAVLLPQP